MLANLVGISMSIESGSAAYIPLKHQSSDNFTQLNLDLVINIMKPILEDSNIIKVGQNIKYDAHIFLNYGINLKGIDEDTKVFIITGFYPSLREALLERGWFENPDRHSRFFNLKWTKITAWEWVWVWEWE